MFAARNDKITVFLETQAQVEARIPQGGYNSFENYPCYSFSLESIVDGQPTTGGERYYVSIKATTRVDRDITTVITDDVVQTLMDNLKLGENNWLRPCNQGSYVLNMMQRVLNTKNRNLFSQRPKDQFVTLKNILITALAAHCGRGVASNAETYNSGIHSTRTAVNNADPRLVLTLFLRGGLYFTSLHRRSEYVFRIKFDDKVFEGAISSLIDNTSLMNPNKYFSSDYMLAEVRSRAKAFLSLLARDLDSIEVTLVAEVKPASQEALKKLESANSHQKNSKRKKPVVTA